MINVAVRDFNRDEFSGARFQPWSMLRFEISIVIIVEAQHLTLYRLTPVPLTASAVGPGVCVVTVGAGLLAKALVQWPLSSLANHIRQQAGSYGPRIQPAGVWVCLRFDRAGHLPRQPSAIDIPRRASDLRAGLTAQEQGQLAQLRRRDKLQ